jgi:hypothetical protein
LVLTQENPLFIISYVTVPLISNGNVDDIIDILNGENTCVVISVIEKSNPTLQFFEGVTVGVTGKASKSISNTVIVADGVGTGSQSQSKYAKKLSWQSDGVGVGVTQGPVVNEVDAISGHAE